MAAARSFSEIRDDIDFSKCGAVQSNIVPTLEGICLLLAGHKIERFDAILRHDRFKPRVALITNAVDVDHQPCEIELFGVIDDQGIAAKHPVSMFNCPRNRS